MKLAQDDVTGCWNWTGSIFDNGYGRITIDGKNALAHRVSYTHFFGSIPTGLQVCHKCDNKRCINPDHLYVGTHNDNMRDVANSDVQKGENNGQAILTQSQVLEIKTHIRERKIVYRKIAEMYGVSRQAIKDIASKRTWGWLEH
jgi:predicted XRE-type DNA-binding protein